MKNFVMFLAFLCSGVSAYADCDKGLAAYKSKDFSLALKEFASPICQQNVRVQNLLGVMHVEAEGVPQDYVQAARYFQLSADQGSVAGQVNLGVLYDKGLGVNQDYQAARRWYLLAANQGDGNAQFYLGRLYFYGDGVTKDYQEARKWYLLAAHQHHPLAYHSLGMMLENGIGLPKNNTLALAFYQIAEKYWGDSLGGKWATAQQRNLLSKMNQQSINQSKLLSKEIDEVDGARKVIAAVESKEKVEVKTERQAVVTGVSVVPGAIVCPDYRTVELMFRWYSSFWEENMRNSVTNGQSRLIEGQVAAPNFKRYGCALIPAGTVVTLRIGDVVPFITTKLSDGTLIQGVTLHSMIRK